MKVWARHAVLHAKAKREGRLVHRHRWVAITSTDFGTEFSCTMCPKRVTERMLQAAFSTHEAIELFQPTDSWPALLPLAGGHQALSRWCGP